MEEGTKEKKEEYKRRKMGGEKNKGRNEAKEKGTESEGSREIIFFSSSFTKNVDFISLLKGG